MFKIILRNLVIIGTIIGVTFLSQQSWFKTNSKNYAYSPGVKAENKYFKKASDWFGNSIPSKVADGVKGLGASVSGGVGKITPGINSVGEKIETQKNNLLENSANTTKKFIAQKMLDALGVKAEDLARCPAN